MSKAIERVEMWLETWGAGQPRARLADLRALVAAARRCEELERRLKLADDAVDALLGAGVRAAITPRSGGGKGKGKARR